MPKGITHFVQHPEVFIREVREHDPALIATVIDIDLTTFSEPTWSRYTAGLMLRHGRTFLLQQQELILGTCQVIRSWDQPHEVTLFAMAIRPGYRNRGLGTVFLEGVLSQLAAAGVEQVVLEVDPKNHAALKVYRDKFGFLEGSLLRDEYGMGHDRVQMRLSLQAREISRVPQSSSAHHP